jgi:hypothetical protein
MVTRHCSRCERTKPTADFSLCRRHGLQRWCRTCQRAASMDWATRNRARANATSAASRARHIERVREYDRRKWQETKADPEALALLRDYGREYKRRALGIKPENYRVGAHGRALVDAEPVYAAVLASGLSLREIARRVGRDREWLARSLRGERVQAATARAVLESVGLIPADVGL